MELFTDFYYVLLLWVIGKYITTLFTRGTTVPVLVLIPIVFSLSIIGVYAARSLYFDLWMALLIGVVSDIIIKLKYSIPAFILAYVLGPIIEENFRRSLM
jgi:putative tricarboxylic transport membrane protein